jgi:cell wall-associated NlpC family hydrolase
MAGEAPVTPGTAATLPVGLESTFDLTEIDTAGFELNLPSLTPAEFHDVFGPKPKGVNRFAFPTDRGPAMHADNVGLEAAGPAGKLVKEAMRYIGTPYVWGGTSPGGFDCSGFVQYVYKQMGVSLPRVSYQQANAGKEIGLNQLRPGDLVAWDNSSRNNGADHIAIYIGNGQIIEAPKPGSAVRVRKLGKNERAYGVRVLGD